MCHKMRRQHVGDDFRDQGLNTLVTQEVDAAGIAANRFTLPPTTTKKLLRTTPYRVSFAEDCDYLVHYCLRAYSTGELCARTLFYTYYTFKNYCLMDFVNCMERYEVWQVVHMGPCFNITPLTEYLLYPYDDDYFLDLDYVIEDH
ncbi:uncharacterized protein LOC123720364 isoform X2 [Pieris brassicae]|nr:uncharacterized protein LOC123720364 isoform X2 [Pieris brassicae]